MTKWIFFDMGSTLLDETDRVNERIAETAKLLQINNSTFYAKLEQAAKTHPYAIKMELPNNMKWSPWPNRLDPLYPDAIPVLTQLHTKYKLGIIANHGKDTARLIGIDRFFQIYIASEAVGIGKPDLRIFEMAFAEADCTPESAVMIGDRLDNDIYPAKKLGMKTIWIKQGFGGMAVPQSEEYRADYEVNSLSELLYVLYVFSA